MNEVELKRALAAAVEAARAAGALMRKHLHATKRVNAESPHDIKLELDVRCQKLIERRLRRRFPDIALLGEEGESGVVESARRWVVDPIDGTVNFAHGMPHAAVSIALQSRSPESKVQSLKSKGGTRRAARDATSSPPYETLLGVVYDPFTDELWTAVGNGPARLNGRVIRVSRRRTLAEAVVSIGFSKSKANLATSLPYFCRVAKRARKVRIMGSAALALTYVATGRFDAYIERRISLWDIAAGGLIVERAGGRFEARPVAGYHRYTLMASNGLIDGQVTPPK